MHPTVVLLLDQGTPITGIWCNTCMTSGGIHIPLVRLGLTGVTHLAVAAACLTCGGPGDLQASRP